jgi:uncharacterized membrane protein YeaQ/YmgE (transglycosylase-associated protein family)
MTLTSLIIFLIIGLVAGWLAGVVWKGRGFGLVVNILIGVVGAFIGGWLFGRLVPGMGGLVSSIITAFVGAIILLFVVSLARRA